MKYLIFVFSFFLLVVGCEKPDPTPDTPLTEEDKLPPATQEGKNKLGCLVNGVAFIPKGSGLLDPSIRNISYHEPTGSMSFYAQRYFGTGLARQYVNITFRDVFTTGDFLLHSSSSFTDTVYTCEPTNQSLIENEYLIDLNSPVLFNISKLDKDLGIISGTFEFNAISSYCRDTVQLTKGRFDLRYK